MSLCCDTYVKNKYLTSEISTTVICFITACSPVNNVDLKGHTCSLYFWYGRGIRYIEKLQRKKETLGRAVEKHRLFSHRDTKSDRISLLTNCISYTCNEVSTTPISKVRLSVFCRWLQHFSWSPLSLMHCITNCNLQSLWQGPVYGALWKKVVLMNKVHGI
jgi:hypothetical protein